MNKEIRLNDKVFSLSITEEHILEKVREIAGKINTDYHGKTPLFMAILNGSYIFAADLLREIKVDCGITFVKLSSYRGIQSTGKVKKLLGITESVDFKDIIILEDIIDSGLTLKEVSKMIREFRPKSVRIAALLYKSNQNIPIEMVDYLGFKIPPDFVVGYGLDYMELGRNLRGVYTLNED